MTGPNLFFGSCGAILEAPLLASRQEQAHRLWAALVQATRGHLGWPPGPTVARVHATGTSLAFAAPEDQLFTATEVNEWAWQRALEECSGQVFSSPFGPGHPPVGDQASAMATLRALAVAEARPGLQALLQEAERRNLPVCLDEALLSIGAGCGCQAWPLEALPAVAGLPWERLHGIPTALVTGSNGKTTSVRLLAAMGAAHGWTTGHTCTDGIQVAGALLETGDYSGPVGARSVLRDGRVELAILETARGGILRRGLAVSEAAVALVTNVSPDHFGEYGVHSLPELADVKLVVAKALARDGLLVLNADDALLGARGAAQGCALGWFARADDHPRLAHHRLLGGATCGVHRGHLRLHWKDGSHDLGEVASMPLSAGGRAAYNVSNMAGAALAAAALGIGPAAIAAVLAAFGAAHGDNPGRLEVWRFGGLTIFMDYAHNPEGLQGLLEVAVAARGIGRCGLLLGQAGNREDAAIRSLAAVAAGFDLDRIVLKDLDGFLRGREPGEVPALLARELAAQGIDPERLQVVLPEAEAACDLLAWARAGDVLVLPVHGLQARTSVAALLEGLEAGGWRAGEPIG